MFKNSLSILFTLFISTILITGCNKFNAEEQALWDQVMKLHDDSMLNHGVMMQNTSKIRKALKSGENIPGQLESAIKPILEKVDAADEAMMSWMGDLKGPMKLSGKSHDEIMTYLNSEKGKIEKIDKDILEQLTVSRNILNVIETPKPAQQ